MKLILRNNIDEKTVRKNKASNEAINEAGKIIMEAIKKSSSASQVEIAEMTGSSRSKVQRTMKKLTEEKVIYRDGARKNGVWKVYETE